MEKAKKDLEFAAATGDLHLKCNAERKVAEAYMDEHDLQGYMEAKVSAGIACQHAELGD